MIDVDASGCNGCSKEEDLMRSRPLGKKHIGNY